MASEMRESSAIIDATIASMKSRRGEDFRELFRSDHWLKLGLTAFEKRLGDAQRDAVNAWLECVGAVHGIESRALLLLLGRYGLADETELARKLEMASLAADADATMAYRLAKQLVRERIMSDPAERRACMQEIFGVMDATPQEMRGLTPRGDDPDPAGGWKRKNGNGAHA